MTPERWWGHARLFWERAHTSLWFVPALLVAISVVVSTALLRLDDALGTGYSGGWWLFGGSASGARTVLSVIAGSLITVVAVAFSITMIAIQQASTQYTPRILRNFTRDRGNQIVLGTYIATFSFALLVLRRVRESGDDDPGFVPAISISSGMLLALVSLALLVYFIHHVAEALQVDSLLSAVRRELDGELVRLFPETLGSDVEEPDDRGALLRDLAPHCVRHETVVRCDEEGYLRRIDEAGLADAVRSARAARADVQIGDHLRAGDVVLRCWSDAPLDDETVERARAAFQLDRARSVTQDPLFGIQQLVDIGVKAMSPGINDPTTAEQTLDHLGGALTILGERAFPSPLRSIDGVRVLFATPSYGDYVDAAFAQLRRAARTDLHVTLHLVGVLRSLLDRIESRARGDILRRQIGEACEGLAAEGLTEREQEMLAFAARSSRDADPRGSERDLSASTPAAADDTTGAVPTRA